MPIKYFKKEIKFKELKVEERHKDMTTIEMPQKKARLGRWYFGGIASAGATCVTHPLDLLKVLLQTEKGKGASLIQMTKIVVKKDGVLGLYSGISASLLRQLTYSTARFGIYEVCKQTIAPKDGSIIPFHQSVMLAGFSGFTAGIVGNPADIANVRMQSDMKLPPEKRRNYKHAVDGMVKIARHEGVGALWTGFVMNSARAIFMTIGQLSFYDQAKSLLLSKPYFQDNFPTHVLSSLIAGAFATTLCQPVDVLKTRIMNAKPGEIKSISSLVLNTFKESPLAFYKGYLPAFTRLGPHTVLIFVFLEQLTQNFGDIQR